MIFPAAVIATIISIAYLLISPFSGILVTLLLKPVIDASWNHYFFGLNCLDVIGLALPVLIIMRIIDSERRGLFELPLSRVAIAYLLCQIVGFVLMISHSNLIVSAEYCTRIVSGFLGFFKPQVH